MPSPSRFRHDQDRSLGWLVPRALRRCPPAEAVYYDAVAQIVMPRWSRGRILLAGGACYAVSLLAGQGASLGVAGAYVLVEPARCGDIARVVVGGSARRH